MKIKNWIYITGAPRGGTTFLGKVISANIAVDYIHEPFNPDCGIPGIDQRFLYLRHGQDNEYRGIIEKIFSYDFSLRTGYYKKDSNARRLIKRIVGSRGPLYLRLAKVNPFHTAAVIKDPIGCLLTEYLSRTFGVKPVVCIRHPAAFAASTRRLGWDLSLEPLRRQPHLVEDFFSDDRDFLEREYKGPIERAAALWRALNKVLLAQAKRNPDWHFIVHEELCEQPVDLVRDLYDKLGLSWSRRIENIVTANTSADNQAEASTGRVQDFRRDSAQLFDLRLGMLSAAERRNIYEITKDVALQVYPDSSFGLDTNAERDAQSDLSQARHE